jgi:two-component system, LuxR family, sensor histidine kinase TtrS
MSKKMVLVGMLISLFCILPSSCFSQDQEYKIGVLANRGMPAAYKEWNATADILSAKTGKIFTVVPLDYDQVGPSTKDKKIDFILTNSAMFAELAKLYGVNAIATQLNQYKNQPLDKFGSVILVKADSPVKTFADLKTKTFACASRSAFGGWLMTVRLLMENGINPDSDFGAISELKTHDNVVFAVLNSVAAAGAVRTGILEKMVQEGKVKMADFKIIHKMDDDFPLVHSTQLYPEYPFAACQHVSATIKLQVGKILIGVSPTEPAAINANIIGWKDPLDYGSVVECLAMIKYGAFKNQAQATPAVLTPEKVADSSPAPPQQQEAAQVKNQAKVHKGRAATQ